MLPAEKSRIKSLIGGVALCRGIPCRKKASAGSGTSVFCKHSSDFLHVTCRSEREHEQDARLLRVEVVGSNIAQLIVFLTGDDTAGSCATGADHNRFGSG